MSDLPSFDLKFHEISSRVRFMQADLRGDNILAVNQIHWNVTCHVEVFSSSDFNRYSDYWIISSLIDIVFSRKAILLQRKPANSQFNSEVQKARDF